LLPEEYQVMRALRDYSFNASSRDFTPTHVLYEAYLELNQQYIGGIDSPQRLNATQFGIIVRKVFEIEPERKTKRWYKGHRVYGYLGVKGPDSIILEHEGPGRPCQQRSTVDPDTTASTAKIGGSSKT